MAKRMRCDRRDLMKRCAAIGKPIKRFFRVGMTQMQIDIIVEAQRAWEGARVLRGKADRRTSKKTCHTPSSFKRSPR